MDSILSKSFVAFLVVWSVLDHNGVHGNDIVIDCPAVRDGGVSTFQGTLYKANISSVCDLLVPTKATFQLTYPTTVSEDLCEQQLSPCNTTENNQGCRCVSDGADAYIFEFNFRFNKSKHDGSTLSLTTDCFSNSNAELTSNNPCDLKEGTSVTSAPGCPICKKGTDCDKPDWICLLFLLLLIPIVILIIILWYFFVHKPKTGDNCGTMNAEEGGPKGSPQNQQTSNGTKPADGKGSSQSQQTTNGNRTVDGKGSTQNQETTNGNRTAYGKGSGQRDNKVGTGHVATNGAHNGEKVSKPVQETELTKVKETSSAPSGVEETSLNGTS